MEQAYHTLLPANRHPLAVLRVSLPPEEVDVNVHPAKSEVKFRRRDAVFRAVQRSVRHALLAQSPVPQVGGATEGWVERRASLVGAGATQAAMDLHMPQEGEGGQWWLPQTSPAEQEKLPPLRVIGQLAQTYIIAEGPQGMYLIDQHAAHERVLYEKLLAQHAARDVRSQTLLEPLPVELTLDQAEQVDEWLEPLRALGFEVEPFGGTTVLLRAVPADLARGEVRQLLIGVLDELAVGEAPLAQEVHERIAAAACKQGAVKAGQTLPMDEMQALLTQLEKADSPRTCPHGRPTMILLSRGWMEHEFGRR